MCTRICLWTLRHGEAQQADDGAAADCERTGRVQTVAHPESGPVRESGQLTEIAKAGNSQRSGFCKARGRTHHVHVQDLLGSAPRLAGVAGRAAGLVLLGHHTSGLAVLVRTA